MHDKEAIKHKFQVLKPLLDERSRRWWAACEAEVLGWGGIAVVSQATGISRTTIAAGLREYRQPTERSQAVAVPRTRQAGGGRKPLTQQDPHLLRDLESLVDPVTRGDPQSPLRWTCKSTYKLASELDGMGHPVGARTVAHLLRTMHTVCKRIGRRTKGEIIPIGMPSSVISMTRRKPFKSAISR